MGRQASFNHAKDVKEFEDAAAALSDKLATARKHLTALETETDLPLRLDLVDLETRQLEASVATTISRGDTLVLMIHRHDTDQAAALQETIGRLRDTWSVLKQFADRKKADAVRAGEDLELFKEKVDNLI